MEGQMSEEPHFEYKPLAPGEIRLINVFGRPVNAFPDEISCLFEHHSIDNLPQYDALSWAWGTEERTETIDCLYDNFNRGPCKISPHLWKGLGTVMLKGPSLLCWVDFLCINQNDVAEKEQQIPLMTQIYGQASNVLVWLGKPEEFMDSVFMTHETLAMATMQLGGLPAGTNIPSEILLDPEWQYLAAGIRRMERLSWFRRSWVCQEAVLAKNLLVLYGENLIGWDLLYFLSLARHRTNFDLFMMTELSDLNPTTASFNALPVIHELRRDKREPIRTDRLINLIRNTSVSKVVDKVYGILGLLVPEVANEIVVDYSKSCEQVYLEFSRAVITHDKTLSSLTNILPHPPTLPSWYVDLSLPAPDTFSFLDFEYSAGFEDRSRQACRATLLPQRLHISVPGFRLGVVSEVAEPRPDVGAPTDEDMLTQRLAETGANFKPWLEAVDHLIGQALKSRNCSDTEIKAAIWRVHIAEAAYNYLTPDPNDADAFIIDESQAFYPSCELMGEGFDIYRRIADSGSILNPSAYAEMKPRETRLLEAWVREFRAFGLRRIFRTDNGLVGMGPSKIQVGDIACVLFDASPVIILRKAVGNGDAEGKECFESVGDGYVYGCMELAKTSNDVKVPVGTVSFISCVREFENFE